MTPFDQEVAAALSLAMGEGAFAGASAEAECIHRTIERLSPRIAAAIEAAGTADYRENPDEHWGYRMQALAALRETK